MCAHTAAEAEADMKIPENHQKFQKTIHFLINIAGNQEEFLKKKNSDIYQDQYQ